MDASDNNNDDGPRKPPSVPAVGTKPQSALTAALAGIPDASTTFQAPEPNDRSRRRSSTTGSALPGAPSALARGARILLGDFAFERTRSELLGKGAFADVFRGVRLSTGQPVAVKVVDVARLSRGNDKLIAHLDDEMQIVLELNHPNIVRMYSVEHLDSDTLCMVFELCDKGDLGQYMSQRGVIPGPDALSFMRDLVRGLRYVRSRNIVHRDIKPQNLLLQTSASSPEGLPTLKIGDFGFARELLPSSLSDTVCGSPLYMAPEILRGHKYSSKADLWSVGAVLYEMVSGKPPLRAQTHVDLVRLAQHLNDIPIELPQGTRVSQGCASLIRGLLHPDPVSRISWSELFFHPWLELEPDTDMNANVKRDTMLEHELMMDNVLVAQSLSSGLPAATRITIPQPRAPVVEPNYAKSAPTFTNSAPGSNRAGVLGKVDRLQERRRRQSDVHRTLSKDADPSLPMSPYSASSFGSQSPPLPVENDARAALKSRGATITEGFDLTVPASPVPSHTAKKGELARKVLAAARSTIATFSPEEEADERTLKRVRAVVQLAKSHAGDELTCRPEFREDRPCNIRSVRDSMCLFLKALGILKELILRVKQRMLGAGARSSSRTSLSVSLRWATNLEKYRAEFGELLHETEDFYRAHAFQLSTGSDMVSSFATFSGDSDQDCANQLMFYGAMRIGSETATAEMGDKPASEVESRYTLGMLLLEQLLDDARTTSDRDTLRAYASQFRRRASVVSSRHMAKRS